MAMRRYQSDAAVQSSERRQREDSAPRLKEKVPGLTSLRLEINEFNSESENAILAARHVRHIVVDHAPALFEFPCTDSACKEGGHDLTYSVMRSLNAKSVTFEGEDVCAGQLGAGSCGRVLRFVAHATYSS